MQTTLLTSLAGITATHRAALKRGGFVSPADFLLLPPQDLAKKCRMTLPEARNIVDIVCKALDRPPRLLKDIEEEGNELFTSGDATLDDLLGGGIRTGVVWELVGEGASGKTQLALQLSLMVQLPQSAGGLSGSACFMTTYSGLPTTRLVEIMRENPIMSSASSASSTLSNIHTVETKSIEILRHVLRTSIHELMRGSFAPGKPPVKLLVIDCLAEAISDGRASTAQLAERSKNLSEISTMLHSLASRYRIAILVVNNVVDVWDRKPGADKGARGDLIYADQARFFNSAGSMAAEDKKSAALGLAWANQVNVRIMLTRTERRRHIDDPEDREPKRRRVEGTPTQRAVQVQPALVRRLTVIFSSVSRPGSLDFIISAKGIATTQDEASFSPLSSGSQARSSASHVSQGSSPAQVRPLMDEVSPLDVADAENNLQAMPEEGHEEDEEEAYWKEFEDDHAFPDGDLPNIPQSSSL